MTYSQALDEALCFGWIDGVRRSIDEDSFSVRFSPRGSGSKWSRVNIRRFGELAAGKRVHASGYAAFRAQTESPRRYSYESRPVKLAAAYARKLHADARASRFFEQQPPWYRRVTAFWIMSAKQEATRERRLGILIQCSRRGMLVPPLERPQPAPRTERSTRNAPSERQLIRVSKGMSHSGRHTAAS